MGLLQRLEGSIKPTEFLYAESEPRLKTVASTAQITRGKVVGTAFGILDVGSRIVEPKLLGDNRLLKQRGKVVGTAFDTSLDVGSGIVVVEIMVNPNLR